VNARKGVAVKKLFGAAVSAGDGEYKSVRDDPSMLKDKRYLERLWKQFEPWADADFPQQMAQAFHERFWEMYLACALLRQGLQLLHRTTTKGPDLCLGVNGQRVWIEATAADVGRTADRIQYDIDGTGLSIDDPRIILRLRQAIGVKNDCCTKYWADHTISDNEPFILGLNGARVVQNPRETLPVIVKAVYAVGEYEATVDWTTGRVKQEGFAKRDTVLNWSCAPIDTGLFLNGEYSAMSGVLFSLCSLSNRPRVTGSDFVYVHNSKAENPLPFGWLPRCQEFCCRNNRIVQLRKTNTR
jgi:hypothetical protein